MTIVTSSKSSLNWIVLLYVLAIHIGALFVLLPSNFRWSAVGLMLFLYWITGGLGITLGWHRLVTHRSFQTPKWLEYFFVFCGTLALQGSPIEWIGLHRNHHTHSDQKPDQHDSGKGFWWSHMLWMFYDIPAKAEVSRLTKDISNDRVYQFFDKYFFHIQVVFAVLLYLMGGWSFVVWGVFFRLVFVYHCTWFVNSATHKFGYRTYDTNDRSTNCWWVALLTYGEGWHNNHHAYQYSARHGMKWWEFDMTWMTIRFLQAIGLAQKVKLVGNTASNSKFK
ncbi:MAG: fatty acid desaturase [Leptolyngbya sp. Prado105]|jgi:stearoyl-CoA desaturase (delta-9 desaturase)|nr:fatty acid desaturase [Leptolyngbya sp. Prado105]